MKLFLFIVLFNIPNYILAQNYVELLFSELKIENPILRSKVKMINQRVYDCNKKGEIKKARTGRASNVYFYFSKNGELKKYIDSIRNAFGGYENVRVIEFYLNDSIIEKTKIDTTLFCKTKYLYSTGLLNKTTYEYWIESLNTYFLYYYDSDGNLTKSLFYKKDEPTQMEIFHYVPDSSVIYRKYYFPDTTVYRKTIKYSFNDKKQIIEQIEQDILYKKEFKYDSLGNLICINYITTKQSWQDKFEYKFDNDGNWVEKRYFHFPSKEYIKEENYKPKRITKREISYYD